MRRLRKSLKSFLLSQRVAVTKTTDPKLVKNFMDMVRPVSTNHALIRVGGAGDGGYLVPDDLDGIAACFSPGVSTTSDFESDLAGRGIRCYLADYSVDAPPIRNDLFDFEKKFLGQIEDDVYMTLDGWVKRKAPAEGDLLLQMDIEGAEYDVIVETSRETFRRFRIIVVEFHGLDGLLHKGSYTLLKLAFRKLLKDFDVVHIHPNNCSPILRYRGLQVPPVLEFTLLRKDRIASRTPAQSFPHPLDRTNVAANPDFALPACWYRSGENPAP